MYKWRFLAGKELNVGFPMLDCSRVFTFPINKKVGVGGAVEFPNHMIVNMEASI